MEKWNIPTIDNRFICIADIKNTELTAIISSYFLQKGLYFPVFIFPNVNTNFGEKHEYGSDEYISAIIGNETSVVIGNSISRMTGCNYVIYAGLSNHQKSYLERHKFDVIDIQNLEEVEYKLSKHISVPKMDFRCKKTQILEGLVEASRSGLKLVIDEKADDVAIRNVNSDGMILVERNDEYGVTSIVGINYAISLGADIHIADSFNKNERGEIEEAVIEWSKNKSNKKLFAVIAEDIESRIKDIDFKKYKFATFFTNGLPYSLYLKNIIPFTYVNISLRPDLFVCNSIGLDTGDRTLGGSHLNREQTIFSIENVKDVVAKLNSDIDAPVVSAKYSTLGGERNVSILVALSLDPKESWSNGIYENSRYMRFHINTDGVIEQFRKAHTINDKFRKIRVKTIDQLISKINDYLKKVK